MRHADAQVVLLIQERRQPVQIEPEYRCRHGVGQGEGPGAAHLEDGAERDSGLLRLFLLLDIVQFCLAYGRVLFRVVVLQTPEDQPDTAQGCHAQKGRLPAPHMQYQRQHHRREHGAYVGAGVEDAAGHGALAGREPQARGFYAGRVIGGFSDAEDKAADHKAHRRSGQAMGAGGQAPQQHGAEEHALDPDTVDQSALQHEADGVAHLKPEVDVGVIHRRPAHLLGQDRLHYAQGSTVDKVEGGGEKHQCEHAPTGFASRQGAANLVTDSCVWSMGRSGACSRRRDHGCLPVSWNFYVVLHNK